MGKKIQVVIFDVGGVLQLGKIPPSTVRGRSRELGIHETITKKLKISLDQYFDSIDTIYAKSVEGKLSEKKVLEIMAENLKISKNKLEKYYIEAYKKNFKFNRELFIFAKKIKKQGLRTAILSDQWHLSKKALVPKKFSKIFNPSIISCDVGMRKPNPEIYKLTLKKLKIKPRDDVFIDNREWNLNPAEKLGMKVVLFKNNKQTIRDIERLLK